MTTTILTRSERLAILVSLLGDDAASIARSGMAPDALEQFESALKDFQQFPASDAEIDIVLEDFLSFFEMALTSVTLDKTIDSDTEQSGDPEDEDESPTILQIAEEQFDVELGPAKKFERPKLTGIAVLDLNRAHPYQVAQTLKVERPELIAIVVRRLADEHAAKTLEYLPAAIRPGVFLQLANPNPVRPEIENRIAAKALELALTVEERQPEEASAEKMASLMRSLPRPIRTSMLDELAKQDEVLAEQVKSQLYQFEDLANLDPRDLQKLLGQCKADDLVVALQQVDEALLMFVLGNMSKRAKESLQEEMEFKQHAKPDEIENGRAEVVKKLAELADSGAISID